MKKFIGLLLLFIVVSTTSISAQVVWPGDANTDSIVSNVDVLYVGYGFPFIAGPARSTVTTNFAPQTPPVGLWSPIFGIQGYHSDCNGDGEIDSLDFQAIEDNYGLSYGTIPTYPNIGGTEIIITSNKDTLSNGDTLVLTLTLGSNINQYNDIIGVAYSLEFENVLDNLAANFGFNDSNVWFTAASQKYSLFRNIAPANRRLDVGIADIDIQLSSGFGNVGDISLIIEEDLIGGTIEFVTTSFTVKDVILATTQGIDTLGSFTKDIVIKKDVSSVDVTGESIINLSVFPNPVDDQLQIVYKEGESFTYQIFSSSGNIVGEKTVVHGSINTESLPIGIYYLELTGRNKRGVFKIVKY